MRKVRKYAMGVLARLLSTLKGQVSILTADALPRILAMLVDQMPAVSAIIAYSVDGYGGSCGVAFCSLRLSRALI